MTCHILFSARPAQWAEYDAPLRAALDALGVAYVLGAELPEDRVEYIIYAPSSALQDFAGYPRLRAVLNLWAGVEGVVQNPTLTVPLTRMVDDAGLTQGMVEWVTGHVLRHHLGMDAHIVNPDRIWNDTSPRLSRDRRIGILGMGALGTACAGMLVQLGFDVAGWSQSAKDIPGVTSHQGTAGLHQMLAKTDILVLLLPLTDATKNILSHDKLARMPKGAVVLNPGRGGLIDDKALLASLDAGHIAHATLDTFRIEPLPGDHPYWSHPHVTITPHIASTTRTVSAVRVIAENIRRDVAGEGLLHLVDRTRGY